MIKFSKKSLTKTLLASSCFLAVTINIADAAEYHTSSVSQVLTSKLYVGTNGKKYTHYKSGELQANVRVEMHAGVSGRFKNWKTWLKVGPESINYSYWPEYTTGAFTETYASGNRPKRVDRTVLVRVLKPEIEKLAMGQCGFLAKELREGGMSNEEIFSKDRLIPLTVLSRLSYDQTGIDGTSFTEGQELKTTTVVCEKHKSVAATNSIALPPTPPGVVTDISVTLTEDAAHDGSRCRVNMSSVFHTDRANTKIDYRYAYLPAGPNAEYKYSAPKTITTDHSKVAMVTEWHDVPIVEGREKGMMWVQVLPAGTRNSQIKHFDMDCTKELSLQTEHPIQRQVKFVADKTQKFGDQVCPVSGHMVATLRATGTPFNGTGKLTVKNKYGQTNASATTDVNLTEQGVTFFGFPYDLKWGGNGNTLAPNLSWPHPVMKQTLKWRLALAKDGSNGPGAQAPERNIIVQCTYPGAPLVTQATPGLAASTTVLPDLTILKAEQVGKKKMKILISNKGKGNASNFKLSMKGGAGNSKSRVINTLKAKKKKWITMTLPKKAPKAVFKIDSGSQVKETNEQNNTLSKTFK